MRFSIFLCVVLVFGACSSPGKRFRGVNPARIVVDGSEFDVYVSGNEAVAIRMNFEMLPTIEVIGPRAVIAMEQTTGCRVVKGSFSGDQAMAEARISC